MDRVVSILERARANVVRAVNSNMVIAYWLIGREIVQELQRGEERAEYVPLDIDGHDLLGIPAVIANNGGQRCAKRYRQTERHNGEKSWWLFRLLFWCR